MVGKRDLVCKGQDRARESKSAKAVHRVESTFLVI